MRVRGDWPNPVALRHGWARAVARPWNRSRTDAHLRLVRGSSAFLSAAADTVLDLGASAVVSPPLMPGAQRPWRAAGFQSYVPLTLMRRPVDGELPGAEAVRRLGDSAWRQIVAIDAAAFGDRWKAELPALLEALASAPDGTLLGIDDPVTGSLAGYAIVASAAGTGYLQRLAVDPAFQRHGYGRTLTRSAHNWARRREARVMILNTKPDNKAALVLYRSEGYTVLPDRLELLRYSGGGS